MILTITDFLTKIYMYLSALYLGETTYYLFSKNEEKIDAYLCTTFLHVIVFIILYYIGQAIRAR